MSPSEREKRKDWKARGRLNKKYKKKLEKQTKKDRRREQRRNVGCVVTALAVGLSLAEAAATWKGWT